MTKDITAELKIALAKAAEDEHTDREWLLARADGIALLDELELTGNRARPVNEELYDLLTRATLTIHALEMQHHRIHPVSSAESDHHAPNPVDPPSTHPDALNVREQVALMEALAVTPLAHVTSGSVRARVLPNDNHQALVEWSGVAVIPTKQLEAVRQAVASETGLA